MKNIVLSFICSVLLSISAAAYANPDLKEIDAVYFTFSVPKDVEKVPVQGVDSFVGRYANKHIKLNFDYGMYSNPLQDNSQSPQFKAWNERISGHAARIVTYRQENPSGFFAAIHFPDGGRGYKSGTKLTMYAEGLAESDVQKALEIYRSIRFKPVQ